MTYSTLNFILDLGILIIIGLFLFAEKPIRVGLVTLLVVASYSLPLTLLERWSAPAPFPVSTPAPAAPVPSVAEPLVRAAAQPGPAETAAAAETLQGVGDLIGSSTGTQPSPVPSPTPVVVRPEMSGPLPTGHPGDWWNQSHGPNLRYGRNLSPAAVILVEQMWLYARFCVCFALIPFFIADGRVTLGIASFLALPVPYLCVVGVWMLGQLFPAANLHGTPDQLPPGMWWATVLTGIIIVGFALKGWWRMSPQRTEVFVPDPELYHARMAGQLYDFELEMSRLRLHPGNFELDLSRAHCPVGRPRLFRFSTGTEVEFVRRPEGPSVPVTEAI